MNQDKISVVINTYNAERHLEKVLQAAKGFDEIVVCDMESTDKTVEIAQRYGCKVVTFPKGEYRIAEPARNFAIQSASNYWVLMVDADEIITEDLQKYLYDRIKDANCPAGLYIPRKNYVMNKFIKQTYPDPQLRFFKREGTDWPPYVHSQPTVDGNTEKIPSARMELALVHISDTVYDQLYKMNQYTENEIVKRKNSNVTLLKIFVKCTHRFFQSYVLKGGFRYGIRGLVYAVNTANYKFYTMVKMWEKQNMEDNTLL